MKQNLTGHDLRVLTSEFQYLIGARLNKVYDISNRSICLKLTTKELCKKYLIIDSGSKIYTISEFSYIRGFPTSFCSKLRKHLNNKRIERFEQIRGDRVLLIEFGINNQCYRLIIELYSSGNILLVDNDYKVLTLLHPFNYGEIKVRVGLPYPIEHATQNINNCNLNVDDIKTYIDNNKDIYEKKIKQIFINSPLSIYGPAVINHSMIKLGYDIKKKMDNVFRIDELENILETIKKEFFNINDNKGYIVLDENNDYISVTPIQYEQHNKKIKIEYNTFEDACSEYFKRIDYSKLITDNDKKIKKEKKNEDNPEVRKLYNINKQISNLELNKNDRYKVSDILYEEFDKFSDLINTLQKFHEEGIINEVRSYILDYKFKLIDPKNKIVILNAYGLEIKLNYSITLHKNIENNYGKGKYYKKKAKRAEIIKEKLEKIENKQEKSKEKKEIINKIDIVGKKKNNWFEEYNWFISSNGFIVISGKNAEHNETIVKKYLEKDDIYVHSNIAGSGSCVIKNNFDKNKKEIPIKTIEEAGRFVICKTKAWKEGVGDKSWWVYPNQVSKTTESGEYVGKGSFIIRGKKNYISKCPLEMGLTILFKNDNCNEFTHNGNNKVQYAIPMCSPYSVVNKNKFKVKLLPGKQKIGKTLKKIINEFNKQANIYERAAIKKINIDDYHKVLISGFRIG